MILDGVGGTLPGGGIVPGDKWRIDVLLVCGRVAQDTYRRGGYVPRAARVVEIPHPAARMFWTREKIAEIAALIQGGGA